MHTTSQQDRLIVALSRRGIPRTVANLAVETGIPKPSIRRTLAELRHIAFRNEALFYLLQGVR